MLSCVGSGTTTDELSRQIKDRITIPILAERLFPGWQPSKSCVSPFRKEKKPSFSVFDDGQKFNDFVTGEHGDVFDFYRIATGCDAKAAFKAVKEMAFGHSAPTPIIRAPAPAVRKEEKQRVHPALRVPTDDELEQISTLRSIAVPALKIAVDRGLPWTARSNVYLVESWIVTDSTRRNYRARRLDGQRWPNGQKAVCVYGSEAAWPIGITEAKDCPCVALCEGEGDFLAAFGHAWASGVEDRIAPVSMSGAGMQIQAETIPLFKGKRVRIFVQADKAGEKAWNTWEYQIRGVAAKVDGFDFGGYYQSNEDVVNDLNDLLRIHSDCWEERRNEIELIMTY